MTVKIMTKDTNRFPSLQRENLSTLQVNLGYKCNQSCQHCHVDSSPLRTEMMNQENINYILEIINMYKIKELDITGGAPELNIHFRRLVSKSRRLGSEVIDRCNLTILLEDGQEDTASFLAENKVIIVASLPCYEKENVDKQRGYGVFEKSIKALKMLNELGYGDSDSGLNLNLVYNPQDVNLPPEQTYLEKVYREQLLNNYGICFNKLLTITNMPINRFKSHLEAKGQLDGYMKTLRESFKKENLENVMCKQTLSVDWQGNLYDCDFNQQLSYKLLGKVVHIKDLLRNKYDFKGKPIFVKEHCFGCTAGNGSSCKGALSSK